MTARLSAGFERSRRDFLKLGGSAALASLAAGCATHTRFLDPPRRRFARVKVAEDRIIRTVVGLRPFRPSGFVVRTETLGDKRIVHNYGHGGGGMTMSWGTSYLAVEQALETGERTAAVIGCGGVGLATARLLQRHGFTVAIYAKDLPPNTTSNIAGAQWSPAESYDSSSVSPAFRDQFTRAARLSHREYQNLAGDDYGIRWLENYVVSSRPFARPQGAGQGLQDLYPDVHELDPRDHPFPGRHVRRFTTMLIEPPIYLQSMVRDFYAAGGRLIVRELPDRAAVQSLSERLIMNCTGLGARALFGDEELTPIKGQLTILLPQPEVDYITLTDDLYMFPRRDGILLGGTHERGVWTLEPNAEAVQHILAGHRQFFSR